MRRVLIVLLMAALPVVGACGGGGGGSSDEAPTITTISELPSATGPMASSASAQVAKGVAKAASTGLNLATVSASDFEGANKSRAACEMVNLLREAVYSAAQADKILCYIAYHTALPEFQVLGFDPYDGQWHIWNLNISDDEYAPSKVKTRIITDGNADPDRRQILSFEMFMCHGDDNPTQNEYVQKAIDGNSFTMSSKGQHQDEDWSGWHSVAVAGTLDAQGAFLEKTITVEDLGQDGGGSNQHAGHGVLVQTPGLFEFTGYRYGLGVDQNEQQFTHEESANAFGEMLNDTSSTLADVAMGDGAILADVGGNDWDVEPFVDSWDGDSAESVGSNDFTASAEAGEAPAVEDVSVAFEAAETWDCTDDDAVAVDLPEMSIEVMQAACIDLELDRDWINCHEIFDN